MRHFISSILLTTSLLGTSCGKPQISPTSGTVSLILNGQVFLRNTIQFKDDRSSSGASASFIQHNGTVYVLTAKHLLGPDMGISPPVQPTQFDNSLERWSVHHNDTPENPLAKITGIINPNNDENEDIILLKTDVSYTTIADMVLPVTKKAPALGERLFVIGCPYSEGELCKQNAYPGTVTEMKGNLIAIEAENSPDSLSGFSGAALLNKKGEIVAVITSGSDGFFIGTLLPDWILD